MSQIKFKTTYHNQEVEVMAGWDRPLGHFYLTVFDLNPDADEEVVWSTLATTPGGGYPTADPLLEKLWLLGIDEPKGFWPLLEKREGNVVYNYVDGCWKRLEL